MHESSVDDGIELDVGIFDGELRVDVEVRGKIRYISAIRRTSTTGEQSHDLTSPVEDDRSRVPRLGEPGVVLAVSQHGKFGGRLMDTVRRIVANERFQAIDATERGSRSRSVLDDKEAFLVVNVEVLGVTDFILLEDPTCLKEAVGGILIVR